MPGLVVARFFADFGLFPAPLWLPASAALIAACLGGMALCPGIFIGSFAVNQDLFAPPLLVTAGISITNTLGPAIGGVLARKAIQSKLPYFTLRDVFSFIGFGLVLHGMVTATGGVISIYLGGTIDKSEMLNSWVRWWLCDTGGALLLSPAILLWIVDPRFTLGRALKREAWLISGGTIAGALAIFFSQPSGHMMVGIFYLVLIPFSWITVRFTPRDAYTLFSVIAIICVIGTTVGLGPFNAPGLERPLMSLAFPIVASSLNILVVGGVINERHRAEEELLRSKEVLEERVHQRTAELAASEERYRKLAATDALTGLKNRGRFMEEGAALFSHARRNHQPLAAIVFDLDGFKALNDLHGHEFGDYALKTAAVACQKVLGEGTLFARLDGEEFAILVPAITSNRAVGIAESMRSSLHHSPIQAPAGRLVSLTASFGVTLRRPEDVSLDAVLRRADTALHHAKRTGRDKVHLLEDSGVGA